MMASAVWFDGHKNRINVLQRLWIVGLQNPALLAHVVFVENTKTEGLLLVRSSTPPGLKRTRILDARLRVQIEGIEDQRLSLRVKYTAVRLVRSRPGNVANICHIEIPSAH